MSAPRTKSPLLENEELAALTIIAMDRLDAPLRLAADAASQLPQPIEEHFAGIILGVCAAYLLDDGDDADSDTVLTLAALVSDYIEEGWGEQSEGDIDQTVRRLVPSAFADAPQPSA